MPIVPISEVKVDAILARPVEDSMGRILINEGEKLSETLINVLKKRGFVEVEVRPESKKRATEELERSVDSRYTDKIKYDGDVNQVKEDMEARFAGVPEGNAAMQVIRVMAQKALVDRIVNIKGLE